MTSAGSNSVTWVLSVFWKRRWILGFVFVGILLLGLAYALSWPRKFASTFSVEIKVEQFPREIEFLKNLLSPERQWVDNHISQVQEPDTLRHALLLAGQITEGMRDAEVQRKVHALKSALLVERGGQAYNFTVTVFDGDYVTAHLLALKVKEAYVERDRTIRVARFEEARDKVRQEKDRNLSEIQRLEQALVLHDKADEFQARADALEKEIAALDELYRAAQAELEQQRLVLLEQFRPEWVDVKLLDAQREEMARIYEGRGASAGGALVEAAKWRDAREQTERKRREIDAILVQYDAALLAAWSKAVDYRERSQLEAALKQKRESDSQAQRELDSLETTIQASISPIVIQSEPHQEDWPVSPSYPRVAWAVILLGLAAMVATGCLLEAAEPALLTEEDVEHYTRRPVLGTVAHIAPFATDVDREYPSLAFLAKGKIRPQAESFRIVKTSLMQSIPTVSRPIVLVTSSEPQEGKSTVSSNLACAFAEEGRKTVLLGCNLRRPTLKEKFDVEASRGVTDIVDNGVPWREAIVSTHVAGLSIIECGTVSEKSSVLFHRPAFQQFLSELRSEFDAVVIDSPPSLLVTDAAILAGLADAVVLVYAQGLTPKTSVRRAVDVVSKVKNNLAGIVLNQKVPQFFRGQKRYYY